MDFENRTGLLPELPVYHGKSGQISEKLYNAGGGKHAVYNDGNPVDFSWELSPLRLQAKLNYLRATGYELIDPEESADKVGITAFREDRAYRIQYSNGRLSVRLLRGEPDTAQEENCPQQTITGITRGDFLEFICGLITSGEGRLTWSNRMEDNLYYELKYKGVHLFAGYTAPEQTARIVMDPVSESLSTFSDRDENAEGPFEICQFGLKYGPMTYGTSCDCGMLYILRLKNGQLFLIDGGEFEQATDEACAEVMRVLRLMSGVSDGPIPIAGWFCTHAHNDHVDLMAKLIRFHHSELAIERVIFNIPHSSNYYHAPSYTIFLDRLNRFYPNVRYLKPHAGAFFTLGGVRFEILQTHENATGPIGNECYPGYNATSTILKASADGVSVLFLGDMDKDAEASILKAFSGSMLRCNAVQAAHHLINNLPSIYPVLQAEIALVPSEICRASMDYPPYATLIRSVKPENQYFASEGTMIFRAVDNRLVRTDRFPVCGGEYDHSAI